MIVDIMSKSFVTFSSQDKVERFVRFIATNENTQYLVIEYPDKQFAVLDCNSAKEILKKIGEKIGSKVMELTLATIPDFTHICESVNIDESELVARSKARKSASKKIVVLENETPVGVIKEHLRDALLGGIPSTLYGERYDIFEKGAVTPKYELTCPACDHHFSFYEPKIENGKILYCCPHCKEIIEQ